MSALLRSLSSHAALALCTAALGLTAVGCSEDTGPVADTDRNASAQSNETAGHGQADASKPSTSAPATPAKSDAGTSQANVATGNHSADAGGTDKTPTGSASATKSLWCDAYAVIQDKCQSCHTTPLAAGAPMPLNTYADATAAATVTKGKKVYEVISTRVHDTKLSMPPGAPLTGASLAAIDAWIADGAKAGDDPTCAGTPTVPATAQEPWPPAGCDASYKITAGNGTPVSVGKGQEIHPQFTIDAPWGDEKVQAIAFRPITDNSKVLHHWILNGQGGTAAFINGWAPGQDATLRKPMPMDIGVYLPSGKASLRLDMHYNNLQGTQAELDQSGVEICVTKTPRKNTATTFSGFIGIPFIAPGQEVDIVGTCNVSVTQPTFLLTESPHAHKLATHMKFEVKRAGQDTVLHDAPFAFDGQISTTLAAPFELKNGDQVITTCHYKNDTNKLVTFGENTGNEMCFNFASYYPMGALSCSGAAPVDIGKVFGGP